MSITAKLQSLDAQVTQKILDPDFKLDNSLGLLQIHAYISTLLFNISGGNSGGGGGGGGTGIDYTVLLNAILSIVTDFYNQDAVGNTAVSDILTQSLGIHSDSLVQLSNNQGELQGSNILATTGNNLLSSIDARISTLDSIVSAVDSKSLAIDGKLATLNTQINNLTATNQVSLAMTPVSVTIATADTPQLLLAANTGRKYLLIQNNSDSTGITVGFSSTMTATTGMRLPVNATFEQNAQCIYKGDIYGYKTGGNGLISVIQGL